MRDAWASADDPMGCRSALEHALAQQETASQQAAYHVAVAWGKCRVFGVRLAAELKGVLAAPLALAAARQLREHLERWLEQARTLEKRWQECAPGMAEKLCLEMVESRMEAWAAYVAIDEAYANCVELRDPLTRAFTNYLDEVLDRIETWDEELQKHVVLLSVAADTPLLDNWRAHLAEGFRQVLPWWLDDCLEEAARRLRAL